MAASFVRSLVAFYRAAELDQPQYRPYLSTLVRGGPVYDHALGFLYALASLGLVGPKKWWIGDVRVESVKGRIAHVEACSFDGGTRYRQSGRPGPADLGGGAGYTSYRSVLELIRGSWMIFETVAAAADGTGTEGPCHGL